MNESIDNKIKNILKELNEATIDYGKRFIEPTINGSEIKFCDIFELALAQERIELAENQFEFLLTEKYPNRFTEETKTFLSKEKSRLIKRLHAWTNRQIPVRE
jgi:hypothetical protein